MRDPRSELPAEALTHLDGLYNLARWLVRDPAEADDLVQETYLRALRGLHQFQAGTNLRAWLFQILRNTFFTQYRRRNREPEAVDPDVLDAMATCAARGVRPASIGIDTWGVDFGLVGAAGDLVGLPRCYRDPAGRAALGAYQAHFPLERLYELTGTQVLPINSIFQLYALARRSGDLFRSARHLLFMPDLVNFWLTGQRCTERTFATTTGLFDPRAGQWCREVLGNIRVPLRIMQRIVSPGTPIGPVSGPAALETGLDGVGVVAVATHDTASAVAALVEAHQRYLRELVLPLPASRQRNVHFAFTSPIV